MSKPEIGGGLRRVPAGGDVTFTLTVSNNGPSPASGITLTDDQLVGSEVERLVLAEVQENAGAHHRRRVLAFVGLVELGHQDSPFGRNGRFCVQAFLPEFAGSCIHGLSSDASGQTAVAEACERMFHELR